MPPRDVICCLQNFALKEDITHRALRPFLDKLREKDMRYTWRFPFALLVTHNGRQHTLRSPEDLPEFCNAVHLGPVNLPEWYQEFRIPPLERSPPCSTFVSPEKHLSKKMKQGGQRSSVAGTPHNNRAHSSRALDDA